MPSSLGPAEILVILVVALIVLGPKRLPEAGRQMGKAISEVRRWSQDVKYEMNQAFNAEMTPADVGKPRFPTEGATWVSTDPVPPPLEVEPPPEAVAAVEAPAPADHAAPGAQEAAAQAEAGGAAEPAQDAAAVPGAEVGERPSPPPEAPPGPGRSRA